MITATIKFQLYDLKRQYLYPDLLLDQLNKRLERFFSSTANDYFVTAFYGVLDLERCTFRYSNAGHSNPCLCRQGEVVLLENEQGLPLGILSDTVYDRQEITLQPGEEVFLYTDGIFEIELRQKPVKSCSGLLDFFAGENGPVTITQIHELQREIYRYTVKNQIADDINYIAMRLEEKE